MEIWIIQDGEKIGPLHDFEVRKRIEHGELPRSTPAWHDGLPEWIPLVEMSIFEREFDRPIDVLEPAADPQQRHPPASAPTPPPLPQAPVLIRRFWARWLDLYLFGGLWWLAMWASGRNIEAALSSWLILVQYVPWFLLETYLLHRFGTTPGKWLLGLKVVNNDGSLLSLAQGIRRSARVLFIGLGFGVIGLSLICQAMAWVTAMRFGRPLWDHLGDHRVVSVTALHPLRIVSYVLALYASLQLQMIVIAPFIYPDLLKAAEPFPTLREQLENNPPWHLPVNQ